MFKSEQLAARRSSTVRDLRLRIWDFLGIWFLGFGISRLCVSVLFVIAMAVGNVLGEEVAKTAPEAIVAKFAKLDRNGDKRLSVDEFRSSMGAAQEGIALRDFDLFDRDADDFLSLDEYWSLPTHATDQRGPLPDPLTAVVDQLSKN